MRSASVRFGVALICAVGAVGLATAGSTPSTDRLDWELTEARTAERHGEPEIAESHRRAASREAWTLLGLSAIADGDLQAAHRALSRARNAAAVGQAPVRDWLALVELHRVGLDGEVEPPLRELRFGVHERPDDAEALERFARALWATGRDEEFRAELDALRGLDAEAAAGVEASIRGGERALPALDPGALGGLSAEARRELTARLVETVERLDAELAEAARLPVEAPVVAPFAFDPAARLASTPESLHGVLERLDAGERDAAIDLLTQQRNGVDGAAARAILGRLLAESGDPEAAEQELLIAIRIDPTPHDARQALARLCWLQDRRGEAITLLRQAAFEGDLERDLARVLAEVEIAEQRWPEAREQLESLHKRFDSAAALLRLVHVAQAEGDAKRAFEAAERATRLAPNAEHVLQVHARLALDIDVATSAARSIEALARMRPEVAEYQFLLGEVWRLRRKMGEASEAYLRAVTLDPELVVARRPLGLALNHESRFAEGREHLERFLEAHPRDLDALAGLAEAEERLGEIEAAERRAQAVLDIEPRHPRARLVLGMIASGRRDFERARQLLEAAVRVDPWLAKAHYQLSFACARTGDRECAKRHLEEYERALEGPESTFVQLDAQPSTGSTTMTREEGP